MLLKLYISLGTHKNSEGIIVSKGHTILPPKDPTYLHVYLEVHNPLCWTYRSNGYTPTQQAIPCKYLISTLVISATVSHVYTLLQVL